MDEEQLKEYFPESYDIKENAEFINDIKEEL